MLVVVHSWTSCGLSYGYPSAALFFLVGCDRSLLVFIAWTTRPNNSPRGDRLGQVMSSSLVSSSLRFLDLRLAQLGRRIFTGTCHLSNASQNLADVLLVIFAAKNVRELCQSHRISKQWKQILCLLLCLDFLVLLIISSLLRPRDAHLKRWLLLLMIRSLLKGGGRQISILITTRMTIETWWRDESKNLCSIVHQKYRGYGGIFHCQQSAGLRIQ
jgi:hypothetical protein